VKPLSFSFGLKPGSISCSLGTMIDPASTDAGNSLKKHSISLPSTKNLSFPVASAGANLQFVPCPSGQIIAFAKQGRVGKIAATGEKANLQVELMNQI